MAKVTSSRLAELLTESVDTSKFVEMFAPVSAGSLSRIKSNTTKARLNA